MSVRLAGASSRLRWGLVGLGIATILANISNPADARSHHRRRHHSSHHHSSYNPPYASIVVDANTGATLQATDPDSPRHPASLTKVMTLYLLFEQLDAGRLTLDSRFTVSRHAAQQPPTKLGLRPGESISVENAIKAVVTRSANDIAVVIAESLGGSESAFCRMMTQKAHELGMRNTVYVNASGLPDDQQITTARDQATLGRAIQERFPRYYRYFSTESFVFRGHTIGNHNHLLGKVEGVDGIKTGYTRDSGFNLLTSMWDGKRHVVAVVMGGKSAARRDAQMRELLRTHIMTASVHRTAPSLVARAALPSEPTPLPQSKPLAQYKLSAVASAPVRSQNDARPAPAPGSTDPIKPLLVKTISVKPSAAGRNQERSLDKTHNLEEKAAPATARSSAHLAMETREESGTATALIARVRPAPAVEHSGWMIQVGAFDAEREAKKRLKAARRGAGRVLGHAESFTEAVERGEKTLYRARFAGLNEVKAKAACRTLKRKDIACMILKN